MQTSMFSEPVVVSCVRIGAYCRIGYMTAYKLLKAGKLPATMVGHAWIARQADLDAWLASSPPEHGRRYKRNRVAA